MKRNLPMILCLVAATGLATQAPVIAGENAAAGWGKASSKNVLTEMSNSDSKRWRFSAGLARRDFGDLQLNTRTQSHLRRLPSLFGKGFRSAPASGEYANGFVRPDPGTEEYGTTWYWGYDDENQVVGDSLNFSASGSGRSVAVDRASGALDPADSDGDSLGPFLSLDFVVAENDSILWGLRTAFSFFSLDASGRGSTFRETQSGNDFALHFSDTYALGGVIPPLAPYEGTEAGPGPLVPATPTSRRSRSSDRDSRTVEFANTVEENLELDLYSISEGLFVEAEFGRVSLFAGLGVAIHFADWEVQSREELHRSGSGGNRLEAAWSSEGSGVEAAIGGYVEAGVGVEVTDRLSLHGFYRYDWLDSVSGSADLTNFEADLNGGTGGLGVRIGF